jgi:hypothetical protein
MRAILYDLHPPGPRNPLVAFGKAGSLSPIGTCVGHDLPSSKLALAEPGQWGDLNIGLHVGNIKNNTGARCTADLSVMFSLMPTVLSALLVNNSALRWGHAVTPPLHPGSGSCGSDLNPSQLSPSSLEYESQRQK